MRRGRSRGALAAVAVGLVGLGLPGCSLSSQPILVAGRDSAGTMVVGAVECDSVDVWPALDLWVSDPSDPDLAELWGASDDPTGYSPPPSTSVPAPPPPDPASLSEIPLVAVGDPDPAGFAYVAPLLEPLPDRPLLVEAAVGDEYEISWLELEVDPHGEPDSYQVVTTDGVERAGLDAGEAAEEIAHQCDDDGSETVRTTLIATGVASLVVVLLLVLATLLTVRQYKRAGVAVADAAASRRRALYGDP